jgi:hypothetical protein
MAGATELEIDCVGLWLGVGFVELDVEEVREVS